MAKNSKPESLIVAEVLAVLNATAGCYAWRNNTGAARMGNRFISFGTKGSADIIACVRGKFVAIECKRLGGKQMPSQKAWEKKITKAGGVYCVVYSANDALNVIKTIST